LLQPQGEQRSLDIMPQTSGHEGTLLAFIRKKLEQHIVCGDTALDLRNDHADCAREWAVLVVVVDTADKTAPSWSHGYRSKELFWNCCTGHV